MSYKSEVTDPIINERSGELPMPTFFKRDIEKIIEEYLKKNGSGNQALYNFYDLSSYGGIEEDEPLPGISAAELFELIDSTYDPKKPTVIYCKSGDYDVTLNCTVVHDAVAQVPSYLMFAGDGTYYYEFTISRLDKSVVIAD